MTNKGDVIKNYPTKTKHNKKNTKCPVFFLTSRSSWLIDYALGGVYYFDSPTSILPSWVEFNSSSNLKQLVTNAQARLVDDP